MGKDTQEIEVELISLEEIQKQEEEVELTSIALDENLIEELYQEQEQERKEDSEPGNAESGAEAAAAAAGAVAAGEFAAHAEASEAVEAAGDGGSAVNASEAAVDGASVAGKPSDMAAGEASVAGEPSDMAAGEASVAGEPSDMAAGEESAAGELSEAVTGEASAAEELPDVTAGLADMGLEQPEGPDEADGSGDLADDSDTTEDAEDTAGEAADGKKKKKSLPRRILKGVLVTLEILLLIFIVYIVVILVQADSTTDLLSRLSQSLLGKTALSIMVEEEYSQNVQETIEQEQISTNEGLDITPYTLEGEYTSFVIFGVDARGDEFDSGTNSDTIIIVTVQNETGRVRMASIYRDTYLQIESSNGGVHYAKANSAYTSGGAVRAINMLNTNFDLALEDYVVVNFEGVADIIDELGGLDITLSAGEVYQLNYHLGSSMKATGLTADKITSAGLNHLNGVQALTYARIRKTAFTDPETGEVYNNDYGRTKRQQYVISLLAQKAKTASVSELVAIVNRVFSYNTDEEKVIGTTYAFDEIISMIPLALDFTLDGGEGYPDNKTTMVMSDLNGADCVIATDLVSDVSALHAYLYDEEDYVPTATVQNIALTILERAEAYGTED